MEKVAWHFYVTNSLFICHFSQMYYIIITNIYFVVMDLMIKGAFKEK
jgi:hypothetical protein